MIVHERSSAEETSGVSESSQTSASREDVAANACSMRVAADVIQSSQPTLAAGSGLSLLISSGLFDVTSN